MHTATTSSSGPLLSSTALARPNRSKEFISDGTPSRLMVLFLVIELDLGNYRDVFDANSDFHWRSFT